MEKQKYILKGHFCYSESLDTIVIKKNHYCICEDGFSKGIYDEIPAEYKDLEVLDFGDRIIMPGLVDLHVHAPQYSFRGLGMDEELLMWLEHRTFPEEAKYKDECYAKKAYTIFTKDLKNSATTRACIFATVHSDTTMLLMKLLEESGIPSYVGKVNMDRNAPEYLVEKDACASLEDTKTWLKQCENKSALVKPILTPRFIPTCSDELMDGLAKIQKEYGLPVQSHLSENESEGAWVLSLCKGITNYAQGYERAGLFGNGVKTIMAHCVYSNEEEIQQMAQAGVFVAHCPQSNTNLSSGIAPIRKLLEAGVRLGLGSDIAGGSSLSIFRAMTDAIQVSKLRTKLAKTQEKPITIAEAFYLATKGGGEFFGKVGSFEEGYELDALVLDETKLPYPQELTILERLERFVYLGERSDILHKFAAGKQLF